MPTKKVTQPHLYSTVIVERSRLVAPFTWVFDSYLHFCLLRWPYRHMILENNQISHPEECDKIWRKVGNWDVPDTAFSINWNFMCNYSLYGGTVRVSSHLINGLYINKVEAQTVSNYQKTSNERVQVRNSTPDSRKKWKASFWDTLDTQVNTRHGKPTSLKYTNLRKRNLLLLRLTPFNDEIYGPEIFKLPQHVQNWNPTWIDHQH